MKYLYSYIVCLFLLFNNTAVLAKEIVLPADFKGETTLRRAEDFNSEEYEKRQVNFNETVQMLYEIGSYFYKKYTLEDIFRDEFIDDVRPFFPEDNEQELQNKIDMLRFGVRIYEKVKDRYNEYIKKHIIPDVYRKVKSRADYDHPDEVPYMAAQDGYFVLVHNFKKFLTYGNNESEKKAIREFEQQQEDPNSIKNKIKGIIKNASWKKMMFYGSAYKNPLASSEGVTDEQTSSDVKARLISQKLIFVTIKSCISV